MSGNRLLAPEFRFGTAQFGGRKHERRANQPGATPSFSRRSFESGLPQCLIVRAKKAKRHWTDMRSSPWRRRNDDGINFQVPQNACIDKHGVRILSHLGGGVRSRRQKCPPPELPPVDRIPVGYLGARGAWMPPGGWRLLGRVLTPCNAFAIASVWRGVVPQHPPTMEAPICAKWRALRARSTPRFADTGSGRGSRPEVRHSAGCREAYWSTDSVPRLCHACRSDLACNSLQSPRRSALARPSQP